MMEIIYGLSYVNGMIANYFWVNLKVTFTVWNICDNRLHILQYVYTYTGKRKL